MDLAVNGFGNIQRSARDIRARLGGGELTADRPATTTDFVSKNCRGSDPITSCAVYLMVLPVARLRTSVCLHIHELWSPLR